MVAIGRMVNKTRKISGRFITIFIPDSIKLKDVFKIINPILKSHGATKSRCVSAGKYGDFSESEHKFESIVKAKSAIKEASKALKDAHFYIGKSMTQIIFSVMPADYETTGSRGIVRPDYSTDSSVKYKTCKIKN